MGDGMAADSLSSNMEDYLEAIYRIIRVKHAARAKDISAQLGVNRSSVTGALHSLANKKLINYAPYDIVTLTAKGRKTAKNITKRHRVLRSFFVKVLGVDEKSADESACKMEHAVSEQILQRLEQFIEFIEVCPRAGIHWIDQFGYFCEKPQNPKRCRRCITECFEAIEGLGKTDGKISH
jgi:DtxR family Mn-dependent transcriptional regulator